MTKTATTTNRITWHCDNCRKPIDPSQGWLEMNYAELAAYDRGHAEWKKKHPPQNGFRILNGTQLLEMPNPVRWRAWHKDCDPNIDSNSYWIDIERINTHEKLLSWTAHLFEKNWFQKTNWNQVIYQAINNYSA